MLAPRSIVVSHETVRQWGLEFRQTVANLFRPPANISNADHRRRSQAFRTWADVTGGGNAA
ncbi:MAG: hypothetical protein RLY86_3819 [Pseudomonadota bacterium]|jgi:transposase-like protein